MEGKNTNSLRMFYEKPGEKWLDALPLGNGRIGAMVYGKAYDELIQLDECTFWSGEASKKNVREGCPELVEEIRKYLINDDYTKSRELCDEIVGKKLNFGSNLPVGNIKMEFNSHNIQYTDFVRNLDLRTGIAQVKYKESNNEYNREIFVSNPHQVVVMKITSKLTGKLDFKVGFQGIDNQMTVKADSVGDLIIEGNAYEDIHSDGKTGVLLQGRIRVITNKGNMYDENGSVIVENADSAIVIVALRTTFECQNPFKDCLNKIEIASSLSYEELKEEHIKEHSSLMDTMNINLGNSDYEDKPTNLRLDRVKSGEIDPGLDALLFNYGRYLLVGSSRENSPLPNHLQGIWNDNLACRMGWTCDIHLDINTQMNYWLTEATNLATCNNPLFKWITEKLVSSGEDTAKKQYDCKGWTAHTVSNAWAYSAPAWGETWGIWPMGGVWIATHLWEHYLYTGDKAFLENIAYPTLRGAAEFVLSYLTLDPKSGYLLSGPSFSPENGFLVNGESFSNTLGPTFDTVLSREIFNICIKASEILKCDDKLSAELKVATKRLAPFKIGDDGQLQEWFKDFKAADPHHRHCSHLLSIYPFSQITVDKTPEFIEAVKKSIYLRVNPKGSFEISNWGLALLEAFYARLKDGDEAYKYILTGIRELTYNNLFVCHPVYEGYKVGIYELDGNTGLSAAIIEMLLQSHDGIIELLPALPKAWDKGLVKGACARGGFEVDIEWEARVIKKVSIRSKLGNPCIVKYRDKLERLDIGVGKTLILTNLG
ncbi:MAG TPA: glycoside hydrolase family 95 protein [Ruminiclostridium sp.]